MSAEEMNDIRNQILENPSSLHDPSYQNQVLAFINELKSSDVGWQMSIESLTNGDLRDDHMKFLSLQVIEFYLKSGYSKASPAEQNMIRSFLSHWIQLKCVQHGVCEPVYIKNKAAQIFALACLQDFPLRWPSFFSDLIETLGLGPKSVDHFLRVLKAVDSEIADREVTYTQAEAQRNALIKNAMREQCIDKLVNTFYGILKSYEQTHPLLTSHCLEILASYIHWIDIGLVVNDQFMNTILQLLTAPDTREAAAVCVHSIFVKGMDPQEKFTLIESLTPVLNSLGVFNLASDDDSDFCTKLSQVVNGIGLSLLEAYTKLQKTSSADQLLHIGCSIDSKIPILVTFLGNDYDDVSGAVLEFTKEYIHFLKGRPALFEGQVKNTHQILATVIHKMKYDDSYQFDHEGEDEAEFQDFRKELKVIFDNIVSLNKDLVLRYIQEIVTLCVLEWQTVPFCDVEVSLAVLYFVCEALPTQGGNFLPDDYERLEALICIVLESGVSTHPHPAIALQFFEIMARYEKLLEPEPSRLLNVIFTFLDTRGMRHPNAKVRSRSAYLFCKVIKGSNLYRTIIPTYTKDILAPLEDLLVINGPSNGEKVEWMTPDDQLFLFEAAGILIVSSALSDQDKVTAFKELLLPIIKKFDALLKELTQETDTKRQENLATSMCQAISMTTRTSKAFTSQTTMKTLGCVHVYVECLEMFLASLQIPVQSSVIQTGVRQFLHRMVVCLDAEILPYIPRASQGLLKNSDIKSMQEYLPLIVQIIAKFKKTLLPFLQECLTPIISAIFTNINAPLEDGDEDGKLEKCILKRLYYQFIYSIIVHCIDALSSQHAIVQKEILLSVTQGAADPVDPMMQKNCFAILRKLIEIWGDRETSDDFIQFMMQNIIQICFEAPFTSARGSCDISSHVLNESAACLKAIHSKKGDEMVSYLESTYLPSLQLTPQRTEQFIFALKSDVKTFKSVLGGFYRPNTS